VPRAAGDSADGWLQRVVPAAKEQAHRFATWRGAPTVGGATKGLSRDRGRPCAAEKGLACVETKRDLRPWRIPPGVKLP
jgi:hypothetical protein